MVKANPWASGALNEKIIKADDVGLPVVSRLFKMVREILTILDVIEAEDARRIAAREASKAFQLGGSHGKN